MSYMFRPQSSRLFLYDSFTKIINNQLQNNQFDPVNGVRLSFQCSHPDCHKSVSVEIDPAGNLSKFSVIDPESNIEDMIFDFSEDVFFHYGDPPLDILASHPLFHMLQQTTAAHYQAGHYTINVTPL